MPDTFHPRTLVPIQHFDDLKVGQVFELGDVVVARDAILEFAGKYDPQPFHLDDAAAEKSIFGGLVASGMQTISACLGVAVRAGALGTLNLAGSHMDGVRWIRPVRPGDRLSVSWTVLSTTASPTRPDRGIACIRSDAVNQKGEPVLTLTITHILRR